MHLLLLAILLVGGALRFHRLDWNDHGLPHPDERAVASQTFDMMVRDDYRPTIHTWGHFGYYSTLFAYKAFLWAQHALNGVPVAEGEKLASVPGPTVPHFREIVRGSGEVPLGLLFVLAAWLAGDAARRLLRRPRAPVVAAIAGALLIAAAAPWIRSRMLVAVAPDYDDVILVGRFLSALLSTASLALVYAIGARLYRPAIGLLAAAFLAVAVVPIQLAHFFIVDPVQAFAVLLAVWLASSVLRPRRGAPVPGARGGAPEAAAAESDLLADRRPTSPPARLAALVREAAAGVPWRTLALYPLVGLAVGVALASKFSSLPLLALPLVTHVLAWDRVGRRAPLASHAAMVLAYVAALGTWYLLHPYAWENPFTPFAEAAGATEMRRRWLHLLFSREFAAQILEQSLMVQGKAGGPWVQQFAGTTPFLTMTAQLVRFSLGWPLGVVAIGGLVWAALRNLRRPRREDLLLLSWAGVLFLALGGFQATFTRYTAPLIPFLCLFGALWCLGRREEEAAAPARTFAAGGAPAGTVPAGAVPPAAPPLWLSPRWRRRAGAVAAALALGGGLLYSLAFVRIYDRPHAWTYASLWIFKNVPATSAGGAPTRIAHEEWDDTIPLHVPPHDPAVYGSVQMAPYHGDGEEKLRRLALWLEDADWICLPTTRLYGTILTVPDRYPLTARYYKALFAGRLGFTLRKTVWEQPRLLGLAFDDLVGADESHHVYDHPKAVLFEKTERLDRTELERRIRDLPPGVAALSRADLLRWRESSSEQVANVARDPYVEDGVVAPTELEERVRAAGIDAAAASAFLDAVAASGEPTVAAVEASAVEEALAGAAQRPDRSGLEDARRRIESLETSAAYRAGDLRRLADATVEEATARDRLVRRLVFDVEDRLLPRSPVLARLARVELGVGGAGAAGSTPGAAPAAAPAAAAAPAPGETAAVEEGRRVRVVAGPGRGRQLATALAWVAALELLGLAALPWSLRLFSSLPGAGYVLAKTLGWVIATYLVWIAVCVGIADLGAAVAWAALAVLAAAAWAPRWARRGIAERLPPARLVVVSELLFVATFAGFALVRAWNPEIFWGEKAMDFSLLNAVLRGEDLPPYEPWFSGVVLNYYYYGFVLVSFLTLLLGTPSALAFNLANAAIPALAVAGAFAVGHALTRRIRWGVAGAALVGFLGNLDPLYQLAREGHIAAAWRERLAPPLESRGLLLDGLRAMLEAPFAAVRILLETPGRGSLWDSYWATSRALTDGMINEYPVWSWLFADLHAHVIVMPLSLLVVALVYAVFVDRRRPAPERGGAVRAATWGALALALGTQLATNTWDFFAYTGLLLLALMVAAMDGAGGEPGRPGDAPERERSEAESAGAAPAGGAAGLSLPADRTLAPSLLFVAAWTLAWPLLGRAHPYWLGLVDDWWIGLVLALGLVGISRLGDRPLRLLESGATFAARLAREALVPAILVVVAGMALFYHFHAQLDTGDTAVRFNGDGFIGVVHALRHFGLFALLSAAWVAATVAREGGAIADRRRSLALLGSAALLSAALALWGPLRGASGFALYAFLFLAVTVAGAHGGGDRTEQRFAAVLLAAGWGLAATSELVVLSDRMNTVFKLYHPAWMLLGTGSAAALPVLLGPGAGRLWTRRVPGSRVVRLRPLPAAAAVVVAGAVAVTVACSWRGVVAVTTLQRKVSAWPTLDGLDFLRHRPEEAELLEAITWLNENVRGPQVVAEAFTDRGYDESARVAQYTGLPILLGWPHHIKQRGRSPEQLALREADLKRLYTSTDPEAVAAVCRRYGIRYVFVGKLERGWYRNPGERLDAMPFLHVAFRSSGGSYILYEVAIAVSAPAAETAPTGAGAAAAAF